MKRESANPEVVNRDHRVAAFIWSLIWHVCFRPTPRWAFGGWRRFLLRAIGASIGKGAVIHPTCRIRSPWNLKMGALACLGDHVDCSCEAQVTIGMKSTVSQKSMLCTVEYDATTRQLLAVARPIVIEDYAWVAANVFVCPGIRIGSHAVVGACSVVTENVSPDCIVGGNPAHVIKTSGSRLGSPTAACWQPKRPCSWRWNKMRSSD
ncbi:MAG: hypothetical protein WCK93_12450 [Nitrosomonadales bacterium]